MKKALHFAVLGALAIPVALSIACSDKTTGSTGATGGGSNDSESCNVGQCPVVVTEDLEAPKVPFEEVALIFGDNCADGGCHGTENGSPVNAKANLFLGADPEDSTVTDPTTRYDAVYASLIKASEFDAKLQRVKPGDWKNSFLMLKLDGCQDDGTADCSDKSSSVPATDSECNTECGDGMPQVLKAADAPMVSFPLENKDLLTVRRWIHQGAPGPM